MPNKKMPSGDSFIEQIFYWIHYYCYINLYVLVQFVLNNIGFFLLNLLAFIYLELLFIIHLELYYYLELLLFIIYLELHYYLELLLFIKNYIII